MSASNHSTPLPWPTLGPTLPPYVHEPVTISVCVFSAVLTGVIALQIARIWMYKFRRISYFSGCLISTFLWGVLRTTLLLIYAVKHHVAGDLTPFEYICLFVIPPCLQFATYSMVALYFLAVGLETWKPRSNVAFASQIFGVVIINAFFIVNVVLALSETDSADLITTKMKTRVLASEIFYVLMSVFLGFAVYKIRQLVQSSVMIEGRGITLKQMTCFTALMVPLYLSRSIYNIAAIYTSLELWGYKWTFFSDEADRVDDDGIPYVAFIVVLFVWEYIPTTIVTYFFWVSKRRYKAPRHRGEHSVTFAEELIQNSYGDENDDDDDLDDVSIMDYGTMSNIKVVPVPNSYSSIGSFVPSSTSTPSY